MKNASIINVLITFKNMDATEALKNYGSDKISSCLKKYVQQDTEAHVVLKVEKNRQIAEVNLNTYGSNFKNSETSDNMYKSIDSLVDSLGVQLRRHKEKVQSKH